MIHIQKAVDPPGNAKGDSWIYVELAKRLGKGKYFPYNSTREIYEELREASRGGHADYFGITYEKIDKNMGIFWPCPTLDHPGTPRLFEDGRSFHPDGKHHFVVTEWRESGDPVSVGISDLSDDRPRGQPISVRNADAPHRRAPRSISESAPRNPSASRGAIPNQGWRLGDDHLAQE